MTITAWICKDENGSVISLFKEKPVRHVIPDERFKKRPYYFHGMWLFSERLTQLEPYISKCEEFSDITWDNDPIEIEITIKRKQQ